MRRWLSAAARAVWPPRCRACDAPGDGIDLCAACRAALPWLDDACTRCALPLHGAGAAPVCGACLRRQPAHDAARAAFVYVAPLDRLLPRVKFHGDLAGARLLSTLMAECWRDVPRPDALVPVPLHVARLRERGYDQALELARPLARALGVALRADALVRTRATPAQSRLSAAQRRRNLRGAFAVRAPLPAHVALFDDVMTTGTTLQAAATALKRSGVTRVDVWVCARVP